MTGTRRSAAIAGMLVLLALFFAASLMAGKVWAPLEAWTDRSDPRWSIIFELRLPRTLLAIIVGAALGLSGAAMQGYTRNSLADPAALGVSSMAALGAVVTLYFGAGAQAPWVVSAFAMVGAVAGVGLLM
ncbi:MAG: transporter permease, partial [Caulobacteraceae bacterium]|nr:transporter permease [Caulobacteraceae bacterium]